MLTKAYVKARFWVEDRSGWMLGETGIETIEWVGMAAVIMALIGGLAVFFGQGGGGQTAIQDAIKNTLVGWIKGLGGG